MITSEHIGVLLNRLWAACMSQADFGDDLWPKGIKKLQEKYQCQIWLSGCMPIGMREPDLSESTITIQMRDREVEL